MKVTHLYEKPELIGAFRTLNLPLSINTQIQPSGRVAFSVTGEAEDLNRALEEIQKNKLVGVRDLLESINRTRSEMFRAKQIKETK